MADETYPEEWIDKLRAFSTASICDQAKTFLGAFFRDEDIDVADVWKRAIKFKGYAKTASSNELEEDEAHKFLVDLGKPMSAIQLRKTLRQFDYDRNNRMSFLEFCMFHYEKTLEKLLTNDVNCDLNLLKARNAVVQEKLAIKKEKQGFLDRIEQLQEVVKSGGVKKFSAAQEIDDIKTKQIPEIDRRIAAKEKDVQKANAAVEAYGPELNHVLTNLGLKSF